ncbi:MAG TPA: hypothetical protein VI588_01640, partial [Candidatus Gracilibacteria bacterium]|nr:hypothetical protein [Candidatus Gracilibacteria bacterium]
MIKKLLIIFWVLAFTGCASTEPAPETNASQETKTQTPELAATSNLGKPISKPMIEHLHGIGLAEDGKVLIIATHDGLFLWSDNQWYEPEGVKNDYMGFSATREKLLSSGHPGPDSSLKNPVGLMKSTDYGKTWETLSLSGEADFHLMTASYGTGTIYVWNQGPNSLMPTKGLYYSLDGILWEKADMEGMDADPLALIADPEKSSRGV